MLPICRIDNEWDRINVTEYFVPFSNKLYLGSYSQLLRLFINSRLGSIVQFITNLQY